jgi:hypothetical protein
MGGGFSLCSVCFCHFPRLDIRQLPACAAGGQADWFGEGGICFKPTAWGQMVDRVSCAYLTVCEIGCMHLRLHRFAMETILMRPHMLAQCRTSGGFAPLQDMEFSKLIENKVADWFRRPLHRVQANSFLVSYVSVSAFPRASFSRCTFT